MENRMKKKMDGMSKNMDAHTQTIREEMQCMGAGLQDGLDKVKGGQDQLKGEMKRNTRTAEEFKIGQGELLRATCWASRERRRVEVTEKVTETVTQTLKGDETTSTRETRRQVTEYTETRR